MPGKGKEQGQFHRRVYRWGPSAAKVCRTIPANRDCEETPHEGMKDLADFARIVGLQGESDELSIGTADIDFGTWMVIILRGFE